MGATTTRLCVILYLPTMDCNTCPHERKIRDALKPCQTCTAGQLHGQRFFDDGIDAEKSLQAWNSKTAAPSPCVTPLPPDVEDAMRKFIASLFGLPLLKLAMVQHLMNGHSMASFSNVLDGFSAELQHKQKSFNGQGRYSLFQRWASEIVDSIPELGDAFQSVIEANRGRRYHAAPEYKLM